MSLYFNFCIDIIIFLYYCNIMNLFDFHFEHDTQNRAPCGCAMGVLCPLKINVIQAKAFLMEQRTLTRWSWITTLTKHHEGATYGNTKNTQQTA